MDKGKNDCRQFEDCQAVVTGLSHPSETVRNSIQNCLYHLYGDDCIRWLIRRFGKQPPGQTDIHNAHHAFSDALIALANAVLATRFTLRNSVKNPCRSYLYLVAVRCYLRLQEDKRGQLYDLAEVEGTKVFPKPDFHYPLEEDEKIKKLHDAIRSMKGPCGELLRLRYIEAWNIQEIADYKDMDKKKLTKQLYDCKEKLRRDMGE